MLPKWLKTGKDIDTYEYIRMNFIKNFMSCIQLKGIASQIEIFHSDQFRAWKNMRGKVVLPTMRLGRGGGGSN